MVELNKIYNENCLETMKRIKNVFVFADPPYNLNIKYDKYNDSIEEIKYTGFCKKWFSELKKISNKIIITPGTKNLSMWIKKIETPKHIGCWFKINSMTGCKFSHLNLWEPLLFYFYDNKRYNIDSFNINIGIQDNIDKHPCPKPLLLIRKLIKIYTEKDELIYDPFLGTGTTAIAAIKENRQWIGSEISKEYCKIAQKRIDIELNQMKLF